MTPETTREQLRGSLVFIGGLCIAILALTFMKSEVQGGHLVDGQGFFLGRDFLNFWHYGIAAWSENPSLWYDHDYYNAVLDRIAPGYDYGHQQFSYPPHYMLLAAPFGLIGYYSALALFTALGLLAYWIVVAKPFADSAYRTVLFMAPPLLIGLICGQVSILLAVLFVAIFRTMDRRPILAGLLIALMTVKPQVGFLFPIFLLATGRYRVFASAAIGTAAFIGASVLILGREVWEVFIFSGVASQSGALVHSHPWTLGLMPTVFVNGIMAGLPVSAAAILHGLVALVVTVLMALVVRQERDPLIAYAVFLGAAFVATPYLMVYDTLILVWAILSLAQRFGMAAWQSLTLRLLMALGPLGMAMSVAGVPGVALVLIAVFAWTLSASSVPWAASLGGAKRPAVIS